MKKIPNESIKKWAYSNSNKLSHPVSVAAVCPNCSLNVVFNTKRRLYDPNRDTSSCSSNCSACDAVVHFWVVDMVAHTRQDGEGDPGVYMLPAAQEHMNMDEHGDIIPDSVLQYCKTAQDIFFSGNLMATNVLIKTALETLFDDFLPVGNSRAELSMMIRDSISTINKIDPLVQLSTSTRKQGDLHALFANHNGTDQQTAEAMMQLLETLVMYLYIMPERFRKIEQRFAELKIANDAKAPPTHGPDREAELHTVDQHNSSDDAKNSGDDAESVSIAVDNGSESAGQSGNTSDNTDPDDSDELDKRAA